MTVQLLVVILCRGMFSIVKVVMLMYKGSSVIEIDMLLAKKKIKKSDNNIHTMYVGRPPFRY